MQIGTIMRMTSGALVMVKGWTKTKKTWHRQVHLLQLDNNQEYHIPWHYWEDLEWEIVCK